MQNLKLGDTVLCLHGKLSVYHVNWTSSSLRRADGLRWNMSSCPLSSGFISGSAKGDGVRRGQRTVYMPRTKASLFWRIRPTHLPTSLSTSTTARFRWGENCAGGYFSALCVNSDVCQTKLHLHLFLYLIAHLNKLEGWWERRKKGKGVGGGKVRRQERGSGWSLPK